MYHKEKRADQETLYSYAPKIIKGPDISNFRSNVFPEMANAYDMPPGQILYASNIEFLKRGTKHSARTRRANICTKDITNRIRGAGNHLNGSNQSFVYVDWTGTLIRYNDTADAFTDLKLNMSRSYHEFYMYNLLASPVLYGCNVSDGIYKINDSYIYSSVFATGVVDICVSYVSGRMIAPDNGHKVYYSAVQARDADNTVNLETFVDWLNISPDQGSGFECCRDTGKITLLWKDVGIWALTNASSAVADWYIPQCAADQGTKSPRTVRLSPYKNVTGYVYLATNKELKFFYPTITYNAGSVPTVENDDCIVISENFQDILKDIPDGKLDLCNAEVFGSYYILNIVSISGSEIDTTIILDMKKTDSAGQPLWAYATNFNFTHYILRNKKDLYGFNVSGYLSRLFQNDLYTDKVPSRISLYDDDIPNEYVLTVTPILGTFSQYETVTESDTGKTAIVKNVGATTVTVYVEDYEGPFTAGKTLTGDISTATATYVSVASGDFNIVAVPWMIYSGWNKVSDYRLRLYSCFINYRIIGKWNVTFFVNSFQYGEPVPEYSEGLSVTINPNHAWASYYNVDFFSESFFTYDLGQLSQAANNECEGNYFIFGLSASNRNEWAEVYGFSPRFQLVSDNLVDINN